MNDGVISGNSIASSIPGQGGGGVSCGTKFAKTGGIIYGYDAGDTQNSNVVKTPDGGGIQNYKGHAVYVVDSTAYHKETTVGPADKLSYRYPDDGDISGWD
jgi:hypothetical protein